MIKRHRQIFAGLLASTSALTPLGAAGQEAAQDSQKAKPENQPASEDKTLALLAAEQNAGQDNQQAEQGEQPVEEIVVRGEYIPEPKRDSSQVSSFISREDFTRTGDDDVSASIRRATGVKLNRGKFVFIRGIGERFASVTLNGLELPSPEPLRRVTPLDIFPTEVLEGITVQKTFSPQTNGEFGGGLINMRTRAVPEESFFSVSGEIGMDTQTTFENSLNVDGGDLDFLGIKDGVRSLSPALQEAFLSGERINSANFSDAELQEIGRSLPNAKLSVVHEGDAPVDTEFNAAWSQPFEIFGAEAGFFFNGNFTSNWENRKGKRQEGDVLDPSAEELSVVNGPSQDDFDLFGTQLETRWSSLATLGVDWADGLGRHELKFTNLYIKSTTKEQRRLTGRNGTEGQDALIDNIEWFDREMFTIQAAGEHLLFGDSLEVIWNFGYSDASRDAPFQRSFQFLEEDGEFVFDRQGGINFSNVFDTIEDEVTAGGIEARYNFALSDSLDGTFYAGWDGSDKERDAARRSLSFSGFLPRALTRRRIDFIFADQNINPNRLLPDEDTTEAFDPFYEGSLVVNGYFVGTELNLGQFVNIDAGVRVEEGQQIVDSFNPIASDPRPRGDINTVIDETDILPSVSVNWTFAENMQLRGAFSQTIGRPQFRELAPTPFINVETDQNFVGNPFLTNPGLDNFDLRWEWYFAPDQFLTAGFFYKNFDDPIETFTEVAGGGGDRDRLRFQQLPEATLKGFEVELNRRFTVSDGFLGVGDFLSQGEFLVALNYTYTDSQIVVDSPEVLVNRATPNGLAFDPVTAEEIGLEDGRSLQGQADHILNVQLAYEDPLAETQVALLFNFTSERIRELGRPSGQDTLPPVLARDPASLDLRVQQGFELFGQDLQAAFSARNLLGDDFRASQQGPEGEKVLVDSFQVGRSLSLSLEARF